MTPPVGGTFDLLPTHALCLYKAADFVLGFPNILENVSSVLSSFFIFTQDRFVTI